MRKIFRIIIASILFAIAIIWAFAKYTHKPAKLIQDSNISYDSASSYSIGEGTVIASKVEVIDINWISGKVILEVSDNTDKITIRESAKDKISEDDQMRWLLEGNTLKIKWCRNGISGPNYSKTLKVVMPSHLLLDKLNLDGVSAEMEGKDLKVKRLIINTVSGDYSLTNLTAERTDAGSVSGNITLSYKETPATIDVNTVSGKTTVKLPEDSGFKARLGSVSGTFKSSIPVITENKCYEAGDGKLTIDVTSVSGDLRVTY